MEKVLVTGAAGFIGYHLSRKLLEEGFLVTGIDNLNNYYSPKLKKDRLAELEKYPRFHFRKMDIADTDAVNELFFEENYGLVYHMAAQAGVRYSLDHPHTYVQSNLMGFVNILEGCKMTEVKHLIYASSSSVYGMNIKQPYSIHDPVDHPISLYAATKKSNELLAHSYSHLYKLPATGLRFFTVYGPWGRPDMASFKFVDRILKGQQIDIYNNGDMSRDFTYVDDIVEALYRLWNHVPVENSEWDSANPDPAVSSAPYRIFNIGNNAPVNLMEFVEIIQQELDRKAKINFMPMQPGDVKDTWADSSDLYELIKYKPKISVREGLREFIRWYKSYYNELESVTNFYSRFGGVKNSNRQ